MDLLKQLKTRIDQGWLVNNDGEALYKLTSELINQFKPYQTAQILLAESDSLKFLAVFFAAIATESHLFICNPNWQQSEWQQVFKLVHPDVIIGENIPVFPKLNLARTNFQIAPLIMIPTGGTSGKIRFTIHTWDTLSASVFGLYDYFHKPLHSYCILPLYHVSGLMPCLRSFLTEAQLYIIPYQDFKKQPIDTINNINSAHFFLSLVPTQLKYLLEYNHIWLSHFCSIFLGGSAIWRSLLETSRKCDLPLALTYGMTETASQIVTLKPEDFLKGNNSNGQVLPHAQVAIYREKQELLKSNPPGIINIKSTSLCLGYYPHLFTENNFITDDLGYFDEQGYLIIVGRNSQKIITGGENVFPAEIEAAILETGLVQDVCVVGIANEQWGQIVTAFYVPNDTSIAVDNLKTIIKGTLTSYKCPKLWIEIENIPRSSQGKIDYSALTAAVRLT